MEQAVQATETSKQRLYYPLSLRMKLIIYFRYLVVPIFVAFLFFFPKLLTIGTFHWIANLTVVYLAINLLQHIVLRLAPKFKRTVLDVGLFVDILWISAIVYSTGGTNSAFISLYYLELIAITLVISYRTGLKIAFLESIFFLAIFYHQHIGFIQSAKEATQPISLFGYRVQVTGIKALLETRTLMNVAILWLITGFTTFFSSVNEGELKKSNQQLDTLHMIGIAMERSLVLKDVLNVILGSVTGTLDFDKAVLFLVNRDQTYLEGITGMGISKQARELVREIRLPIRDNSNIISQTATEKAPKKSSHFDSEFLGSRLLQVMGDQKNFVCIPLLTHEKVSGVLTVEKSDYKFYQRKDIKRQDINTLLTLGNQAALAIENAVLHEQTRNRAATDALTGLYNHRYFQERLDQEVRKILRYKGLSPSKNPISFIMLDVDYFKHYNDRNGHPAGDALLKEMGKILKSCIRDLDTVARYGGEEFAVILPQADAEKSLAIAERIREEVAHCKFHFQENQPGGNLTVSLGVATFPSSADSIEKASELKEKLVCKADEALYHSKSSGRNKVTHWQDISTEEPEKAKLNRACG